MANEMHQGTVVAMVGEEMQSEEMPRLRVVGRALRERREQLGISRHDLAASIRRRTGTSTNGVQVLRIEQGKHDTKASVLLAFALSVEFPVNELAAMLFGEPTAACAQFEQKNHAVGINTQATRAWELGSALAVHPAVCSAWLSAGRALLRAHRQCQASEGAAVDGLRADAVLPMGGDEC